VKPGRELDALVAEKVFGCKTAWAMNRENVFCGCAGRPHGAPVVSYGAAPVKNYSTDIAAAWEVVGRFGDEFILERWPEFRNTWRTSFQRDREWASAATAPHAICLAALRAVGHEVPA